MTVLSSVAPHLASFRTSSVGSRSNGFRAISSSSSRRLALFHLGAAIPQAEILRMTSSKLLRAEENNVDVRLVGNVEREVANVIDGDVSQWVKNDKRRMLHVVCRVGNLDETIKFYTQCLGMKVLRKRDIPEERYSNAFLGYGPEDSHFAVELTYNYGVNKYDIGDGFGHFGIAVDNVSKAAEFIRAKGGQVALERNSFKGHITSTASVKDPDGYKFKLFERQSSQEPFCQVMLRVGDLNRSIKYYEKAFGMKLLHKLDNPDYKYTTAMMGYGPEDKNTVLALTYNYGVQEYDKGNAYGQIAIGTDDVYRTAKVINQYGGNIILEPGPLPVINTKITICTDPDGWKSVFVDNKDFAKELK